jgi:hypothetical protein
MIAWSPQQKFLNKEDTTSPTIMTELVMLSCMIDAKEGQSIATADIPSAFMQTNIDKTIQIWLTCQIVVILNL